MSKVFKFPSINQFYKVCEHVLGRANYLHHLKQAEIPGKERVPFTPPVLDFKGTVKIDGSNTSVIVGDNFQQFQSRETILTVEQDYAGFAQFLSPKMPLLQPIIDILLPKAKKLFGEQGKVGIYGEWCGKGVQKGVAISKLDKRFVIFGIKLISQDEEEADQWQNIEILQPILGALNNHNIYSILQFKTYSITIDFGNLEQAKTELEKLLDSVEQECPVAAAFGIQGIGEGVVFSCTNPDYSGNRATFKVKGQAHKQVKHTPKVEIDPTIAANAKQFAEMTVTEARLQQGLNRLTGELKMKLELESMGEFLKWIAQDVFKEESDRIKIMPQEEKKRCNRYISEMAKQWFIEKVTNQFT